MDTQAWQIWSMIGFTLFWFIMAIVIWRLKLKIKRLNEKIDSEKAQIRHFNLEDGFPGKYKG